MKAPKANDVMLRLLPRRFRAESVYFYTFHKCASTLFSNHVLKRVKGFDYVNYAGQIYNGERDLSHGLTFRERGCLYGPIRVSAKMESPVGRLLVGPTTTTEFIRDKTAVFFVRDPRDILVSAYYSFGMTHDFSALPESRQRQMARQEVIRTQTLDEYVLSAVDDQVRFFFKLHSLSEICKRGVVLRYEDMIHDFEAFAGEFVKLMPLSEKSLECMRLWSRPKAVEDPASHRRSGKVGGFKDKLKAETVGLLNDKLAETLRQFRYQP